MAYLNTSHANNALKNNGFASVAVGDICQVGVFGRVGLMLDMLLKYERNAKMPEISRFFGIIIRMFYNDHNPPHFHVEFQGNKAVFDFQGSTLKGNLKSKTATKLVRE